MSWEILVTLTSVALLALLHVRFAASADGRQLAGSRLGTAARDLAGGRDPWTRALVATAVGASIFALGVVAVPALFGESDEDSTQPTVTAPTVTQPTTATSPPTTSAPSTTTAPVTTAPLPTEPPAGTVLLAEAVVRGSTGQVVQSVNRLGAQPVVRSMGDGVYRVLVPGMTPGVRRRSVVRVAATPETVVDVRKSATSPALIVTTRDASTGELSPRMFTLIVFGPPSDARAPRKPTLPKTS